MSIADDFIKKYSGVSSTQANPSSGKGTAESFIEKWNNDSYVNSAVESARKSGAASAKHEATIAYPTNGVVSGDVTIVQDVPNTGEKFSFGTAAKDAGASLLTGIASGGAAFGAWAENIVGSVLDFFFQGAGFKESGPFNTLYKGNADIGMGGIKNTADYYRKEAAANAEKINTGNKTVDTVAKWAANKGNDLAYAVGAAAPMAVTAGLGGAASAASGLAATGADGLIAKGAQVVEKTGVLNTLGESARNLLTSKDYWTSFAQEVGQDYFEALEDGATEDEANVYAMATALANSIIEVGGGIQNPNNPLWKSALEEGKEEIEQGPLQRLMQNVVYNKGNEMFSTTDSNAVINPVTMAEEFGMGAAVGGILSGGQHIAQNIAGKAAENNGYADMYGEYVQALVNESNELNPGNKLARQVQKTVDAGHGVSGAKIKALVAQNESDMKAQGAEDITPEEYADVVQKAAAEPVSVPSSDTPVYTPEEEKPQEPSAVRQEPATNDAVTEQSVVEPEYTQEETEEAAEPDVSLASAAEKYGKQAGAFTSTYQPGQDVEQYAAAYDLAYECGRSGVPFDSIGKITTIAYLGDTQREIAYEAGASVSDAEAAGKETRNAGKANGKKGRRKGTVKGEGVTAADLKSAFNVQQGRAYNVLATVAEATGIDIILYKSEAGEDGEYRGAQGAFKHTNPDRIYIDINAGLLKQADANDLAKYAMLRTFSHEFAHFIEYWNPIQYNELRKVIFAEIEKSGEDVNDLISLKMETTGLDMDAASREVVAEALTDVLPDSSFVQTLSENHKSIFNKLLDKLREFVADLKAYFHDIGTNRSREANALKNQVGDAVKYVEGVVDIFDKAAENAVEKFQSAYAVEEETTVQDEPVKQEEPAKPGEKVRFTIAHNDQYDSTEISFSEKPSFDVLRILKSYHFRWNGKKKLWYGKASPEAVIKALEGVDDAPRNVKEEQNNEENGGQGAGGETVRQDNDGAVLRTQPDGQGAARLLDEVQAEDVQVTGRQRETVAADSERGDETERDGDRAAAADRDSGSEGSSQSGDLRRDGPQRGDTGGDSGRGGNGSGRAQPGDLGDTDGADGAAVRHEGETAPGESGSGQVTTAEEEAAKAESIKEAAAEQTAQQSTPEVNGRNFVIGDSLSLPSGEKSRFRANIDAIKLVKRLVAENRYATETEQETLSKYVGWGGLSNAFGEMKWNSDAHRREMAAKPGWEKEFAEFRQLVTDGVITEEEYSAMSASTKNAHYTSVEVIKAMYDGLSSLGFTGGRMLEPSSGVGNFVGGMPAAMSGTVNSWTMVELDTLTGQIAKYLYPHADVRIQGFETANIADNYMDVAIGNVPFGDYGVVDRHYPKRITKAIHNYFFAKTLDKVRPGGLVMFITSSFTMNGQDTAVRQYIMDRADLLGAIRLPNTAFSGNAGTQVVTDILVLKKRVPGTPYAGETFLESPNRKISEDSWQTANINEYFDEHPEMVLGTAEFARGMYGANTLTYAPLADKGPLGGQIREAFKHITGKMDYRAQLSPEKSNFASERAAKKNKASGGLEVREGKVYRNDNGKLTLSSDDRATAERVEGMLRIRDAYKTLVAYLQQGQSAQAIKKARQELNKDYDAFVAKYGLINSAKNKAAIEDDPDQYSLCSLENYNAKEKTATKADIFTKDTIRPNKTITHVDDVASGVIVSMNKVGGIDVDLISTITGKTKSEVTRELIDGRMAFKTRDGTLEAPEKYLSGNVRAKLREAEALAPFDADFRNNVEALKDVVPEDIPFNEIYAAIGTPWVPNNVYADFIAEMLGGYNNQSIYAVPDVEVGRTSSGDFKIVVNNKRLKGRYQNSQKWGTKRRTFLNLMESIMANRGLTVNDYVETADGKKRTVVNTVETAAAQSKAEEIQKEFQDWLWRDETRRKELASLYNDVFNALSTPKYSGAHLTINGLASGVSLYAHQADAVQRIISSGGNTLLAHKVGAGKTLEMAAAAMKLKELGVIKKPAFVVPKALVSQWGVEFKSFFPSAKLLVSDEKSFSPTNRRVYANRIANGEYDAVILSYEQFEKIPVSAEYKKAFYQQQIDEILDAIAEEKAESRDGRGITVKEMEKKKASLEKKIAELNTKAKDEDNIDFESLGIDSLFVDEAHSFKNLQYITHMSNVAGLGSTNGSQRAFDLYTKVRYLQGLNGGRGIVFATATPVMNSMSELYIMQRYLQQDMLDQLGLRTFDAWAKQFGEVVNAVEIKPSGQGFRVKQTFSNFRNLGELQLMFRSFSDVLTKVPGLKIPKMRGGAVKTIVCEPGQFQREYMKALEERSDNIKNVDPRVDNMLKITSDGRKAAYTQRMIDPSLPYEPGCKIYRCCDNVLSEYKASTGTRGAQIIFCDLATPKGASKSEKKVEDDSLDTDSAKLYDDMKAYLVKRGIPSGEIAFIHDAKTDEKRKQLFADVNDGKIRVLIGSTGKMGVGMNAQRRMVAIHHLDAPWRPGDVEQRDGRVFRQKNMNDEVSKYTYVTEGSFDARLWDILDRKQHFIEQVMNGDNVGRSVEDTGDVTLSAAEVKALASGNPMIMEQVQLSNDLLTLNNLRRAYNSSVSAAKAKLSDDESRIVSVTKSIASAKDDIKRRVDTYSDGKFSMKIGGDTFTDKKKAGVALSAAILASAKPDGFVDVGSFAGFTLRVMKSGAEYNGLVAGKNGYKFNVYAENTTYMINHIISVVEGIDGNIAAWEDHLAELKIDVAAQKRMAETPFAKQDELSQKMARYNEIMSILNPKDEQVIGDDEADGGEEQYQQRNSPLTDREVLSIASSEVSVDDLTPGEADALHIFQNRLEALRGLEEQRAEAGRLYKQQQFGPNVNKAEAQKTLNRMGVLDQQIKRANESVLDVEKKEVLRRVLQKSRTVVETAERERGSEILRRYKDRASNAAAIKKYRERIKKDAGSLTKWILHPDNKSAYKHVPDALKSSVIPFIASIDFSSKRELNGGASTVADREFIKRITALRDAIKRNIDVRGLYSGYNDLPEGFMTELQKFIDAAQTLASSGSGSFVINRMTAEELKTLSKLVRVIKKLVTQANSFHQNAMFQHVNDAGDSSIWTMGAMKDAENTGTVSDFLLWQQMRPAYAFERFGSGGVAIYDELRRGQSTLAFNTIKIKEFADKAYTDAEVRLWEKETKTFTLDGDTVEIPVSYLMGFYELTKRPQALGHIIGEGIRVATYKKGSKEKISDTGHKLSEGDVQKLLDALTPRQKEVADALQEFMARQGGAWGNYVSVARFGEELFGEVHYYPINSDGRYLDASADEHPNNASLYALLNMSFTKSLQEEANNRIILYSIFDVFANHMASMAQYNALALPVLDSLRWLNYQQVQKNDDGSKTMLGSVREQMARVYGVREETKPGSGSKSYAENFVLNIIKAFNGTEAQGVPMDGQYIGATHRYNMAQVAYNLRVVVQQPLSITRAGAIIDYRSIVRGLKLSKPAIEQNIAEMEKYSGIAAWKSLGFYDVNISRGLADVIKHNSSVLDKIGDVGMWGAEKADLLTWAAMWSACKEDVAVKKHLKRGTPEFYDAVTKLFEEVIYKTQVVDSILTKNEFLRSKGAITRLIGSFMSEPTTTASMLLSAYDKYARDIQRGFSRRQAWKLNEKNIIRTAYVYAIGSIMLAAVTSALDGLRDDDDYETFAQKWLEAFKGNIIDELMPLNKLPLLRDVYELIKSALETFGVDTYGNEPRSVIFQWRDYLIKSLEIINDNLSGNDTKYTMYGGIYKLLQAASGASGIPLSGVTREVVSAWNNIVGAMAPSLKVKTYDPGAKNSVKYAYQDGNITHDEAVQFLIEAGLSEEDATRAADKWEFAAESTKFSDISEAAVAGYKAHCIEAGISKDVFYSTWSAANDLKGTDTDEDGKTDTYSLTDSKLEYINSLKLTPSQKYAMALALGIKESTCYKRAPW